MALRHPDFERAIDENPLEATNHLVYADWLDENGEHDEAAFRRAMGKWVQTPAAKGGRRTYWGAGMMPRKVWTVPWTLHHPRPEVLPEGVSSNDVPWTIQRWDSRSPENVHEGFYHTAGGFLYYPEYRHMEEGFRRAFMTGRKQTTPEQLTRRRMARKRYEVN